VSKQTATTEQPPASDDETDLSVGPAAIANYARMSYELWYAFAEFIDNATQSRLNYGGIIDDVLAQEGSPLVVNIVHNRMAKTISIEDNSIGMTKDDLKAALHIAQPTPDSKGRSKYGMGMKTAACWLGKKWQVVTTEWDSPQEWTAEIDVANVASGNTRVPLLPRVVNRDDHYTKIIISGLNRGIQQRTEETIRWYLGSMYRFDLASGRLKLTYNGVDIPPFEEVPFDTDDQGKPYYQTFDTIINGKNVRGWFAVLRPGKGGRKFGGFALFQNQRQIQGFPKAWKPKGIFGGVDDEGANNLIAQRLTGLIEFDPAFQVSHTKDAILFSDDEEDELEKHLEEKTRDYRNYAQSRRGPRAQPWSKEKLQDLVKSMEQEFTNPELRDALNVAVLPPLETITENNRKQIAALRDTDRLSTLDVLPDLKVIISEQERSEYDPHLIIQAGAEAGTIHVIVNRLHPYYASIESSDALEECLRQYIYDAIAEYKVSKLESRIDPTSVRRLKNDLLKAKVVRILNAAAAQREGTSPG
jgi:hypothetical protein